MSPSTNRRPIVLVVDDAPQNLSLMDELLSDKYQVKVAPSGDRALSIAHAIPQPDLILLDVMMPEMDGFEVCRRLKSDPATQHVPVIFLTARNQIADENLGLELGAVDYISKPVSPPIVLARVKTHLLLKAAADFLQDRNVYLENEVIRRTEETRRRAEELQLAHEVIIVAMASIAETRDNETGNHILRTQHYVRCLAERLGTLPRFNGLLDREVIDTLFKAAPLHDIGKVGVPDSILLKPGPLTAEEFEIMKTHTTLGFEVIEKAQQHVGVRLPVLEAAKEIAHYHQEKWDGSGYPEGLSGERIPLSARLMALADVYDALVSRRVYKEPMPHLRAVEIIKEGRGKHFDPVVVDAFVEVQNEFNAIATRFHDEAEKSSLLHTRLAESANTE